GLCGLQSDVRFQSRDDAKHDATTHARLVEVRLERRPNLSVADYGKLETGRHYSDHGVIAAVEHDCLSDDCGIASETSLPKTVAQNDRALRSAFVLFRSKSAA